MPKFYNSKLHFCLKIVSMGLVFIMLLQTPHTVFVRATDTFEKYSEYDPDKTLEHTQDECSDIFLECKLEYFGSEYDYSYNNKFSLATYLSPLLMPAEHAEFTPFHHGTNIGIALTYDLNFGKVLYRANYLSTRYVTILGTGRVVSGGSSVFPAISGLSRTYCYDTATAFTIGYLASLPNLPVGQIRCFIVEPVLGLYADGPNGRVYNGEIIVSAVNASSQTATAQIHVMPRTAHTPAVPTITQRTTNSIMLSSSTSPYVYWYDAPIPNTAGWTVEYRLYAEDGITVMHDWQESNVFTNVYCHRAYKARVRFRSNDASQDFPYGRNHITTESYLSEVIVTKPSASLSKSPLGKVFAPEAVNIQVTGSYIEELEYFVVRTIDDTNLVTEANFTQLRDVAEINGSVPGNVCIPAHVNGIYWIRIRFTNGATLLKNIKIDNIYTPSLFVRGLIGNRELFNEKVAIPHGLPLEYDGTLIRNPTLGFVEVEISAKHIEGYAVLGGSVRHVLLNCCMYKENPYNTITFMYYALFTEPGNCYSPSDNDTSGGGNSENNVDNQPPVTRPEQNQQANADSITENNEPQRLPLPQAYNEPPLAQPPANEIVEPAAEDMSIDQDDAYAENAAESASDASAQSDSTGTAASNDDTQSSYDTAIPPEDTAVKTSYYTHERRMITYTLSQIANDGSPATRFSIISRPAHSLKFYSGSVPAFSFGEGLTYTILFRTRNSAIHQVLASGVSASESFRFYNTTREVWVEIVLLFEHVPSHFAYGNRIYYTFEILAENYYHGYGLIIGTPHIEQSEGLSTLKSQIEMLRSMIAASNSPQTTEALAIALENALEVLNNQYATDEQIFDAITLADSVIIEVLSGYGTSGFSLGDWGNLLPLLGGLCFGALSLGLGLIKKRNAKL